MADETFYKRLTRIFQSGPTIRKKIRGKTTKFSDQTASQNDLGIYNGHSYKREQSNLALLGAYGIYDRMSRYAEFQEMEYSLHPTSKIAVPGGYKTIKELHEEYGSEKEFIVYSYDHNKRCIVPALAKNVRQTCTEDAYKVIFDNGKEIIGSANHRLMKRDGSYCFIGDLKPGDAMMPFLRKASLTETREEKEDECLYVYTMDRNKVTSGWQSEYRLISEWILGGELSENEIVHHKNFKKHDNRPENLDVMDRDIQQHLHSVVWNGKKWDQVTNAEWIEQFKKNHSAFMKEHNPAERKDVTFGKILQICEQNGFNLLRTCAFFGTDPNVIKRRLRANGFKDFETFTKAYCPDRKRCENSGDKNPGFIKEVTFQKICSVFSQDMSLDDIAECLHVSVTPIRNRLKENGYDSWTAFKETYDNCKVVSVELYAKDIQLYDLTVEGYKNFATDSVISHNTSEISTALDLFADESCSGDERGKCFHVHSENPDIQRALEELFYEVANVDFELRQWIRNLVKYGDSFLYVEVLPNEGITKLEPIHVNEIDREEGYDREDPDAVRFKILSRGGKYLENWQVVHFRVKGNDLFYPYGTSFLESARRVWRQLIMMEDAVLIYRLVRSPERRVFYIDCAGIHPNEIPNYMEQVKQSMRANQAIDRANGRLDQRYQPIAVDDDIFLPTKPNSATKIDSLPGGQHVSAVEDIEFFHKKLTGALKVPRAYLGFEDTLGSKATLSQEDIRFSRTIGSLQKIIISELNQLAILHLFAKGFDGEDLKNFTIKLSNPSTIALQQKLNLWSLKFEIAGKAKESGLVDEEWVQKEILELSHDSIIQIRIGRESDQLRNKTLEALEPPDPNVPPDDSSIVDPFDPSNFQVQQTSPQNKGPQAPPKQSTVYSGNQVKKAIATPANKPPITPNPTPKLDQAARRSSRIQRTGPLALAMPDFAKMLDVDNDVFDADFVLGSANESLESSIKNETRIPKDLGNHLIKKLKSFEKNNKNEHALVDIEILREDKEESILELLEKNQG